MTPREWLDLHEPPVTPATVAAVVDRSGEILRAATDLQTADPSLPLHSALTIAGDRASAEPAERMIRAGVAFDDALPFVGSYARVDFAVRMAMAAERFLSYEHLIEILPGLWSGSDPDDTDPRFLALWQDAWRRNRRRIILDGPGLPVDAFVSGRNGRKYVRVFRGQDAGSPLGIAWTTDRAIAVKFAAGAALRTSDRRGDVLEGRIHRRMVMAFLTGRGESEVILDPGLVS